MPHHARGRRRDAVARIPPDRSAVPRHPQSARAVRRLACCRRNPADPGGHRASTSVATAMDHLRRLRLAGEATMTADEPLYRRDPEAWQEHLAEGNARQARKRVGADAILRDSHGRILLVDPDYKPDWDLPG